LYSADRITGVENPISEVKAINDLIILFAKKIGLEFQVEEPVETAEIRYGRADVVPFSIRLDPVTYLALQIVEVDLVGSAKTRNDIFYWILKQYNEADVPLYIVREILNGTLDQAEGILFKNQGV
jgi:hypothetical protein